METVELLVQRGADVNFRGSGNFGALYRSIFSDHFDIFNFLLSKGACLDEHDKEALSGWEMNKQSTKYRELLGKNKGCINKTQPTK
jgi:ankyrin repeat protein